MTDPAPHSDEFDQRFADRLAAQALAEQRRTRRWGIFFRFAFLAYLSLALFLYSPPEWTVSDITDGEHTALVDLRGVIADDAEANADDVALALNDAFEARHVKGIILRLNSPGGSPVQAAYVNNEIRRLREEHPDIPLYAVISDVCASGCYYIAAAADAIYANESSIVGSIGVIMEGFGFVDTLQKLGVERRVIAAGEHKALYDPFAPVNEQEAAHLKGLVNEIHKEFIRVVQEGRGDKLKNGNDLYTGLIWSGRRGQEIGLVDDLASAGEVARDVIGAEEIVDYTVQPDVLERLAERVGAGAASLMNRLVPAVR